MKRVIVGLSGGVDSSVAAYLLKEQGYEVIGIYMRNWHDESVTLNNECPWIEDSNDALIAAEKLGIPFQTLDLSKEYKARIVDYMFAEYKRGRTPNPDILCNREIKFDVFLDHALKLGADFVATGHYCQKAAVNVDGKTYYQLLAGADKNKDQSYFLCQVTQAQLARILFPIGHLAKSKVRTIAREIGLENADKKDSQGLCFVGKVKLPDFLMQQLAPRQGDVIEVPANSPLFNQDDEPNGLDTLEELLALSEPVPFDRESGQHIGSHPGAHFFTIGQRKGLNIGGKVDPLFVLDKNTRDNILYTGMGADHPGLYRKAIRIRNADVHWLRPDKKINSGASRPVLARIRYRQPLEEARLVQEDDYLFLVFNEPQKGVAPGQFAAWYEGEELLGSGVIH